MPIRKRLTLWYTGLLTLLTLVIGAAATATMYFTLVGAIDRALDETADYVILNSRAPLTTDFGATRRINISLPPLDTFQSSGVYVQVWQTWDGDTSVTPRFSAASTNLGSYDAALDGSALTTSSPVFTQVTLNGVPFRVLTRPIPLAMGGYFGVVQVAASLDTVARTLNRMLVIMIGGGVFSIGAAIVVGMMLSQTALKPVKDITLAAASIADTEDLGMRLPWHGPRDELGQLTSVFNHMMDRLEHLFDVQKRFVADVSHELRTPLTAIRGNLDMVKRYGADAESLEAIESEVARMQRMVNDLLTLARADNGDLKLDLYPVDLDTIVSDVYREAKVLAKDRALKLSIGEFAPLRVSGNSDRLKQLLLNLVGNAIKFTPDGGKISLHLLEQDNNALIRVVDTGIGMEAQDLVRIFDRFYQADSSRVNVGGSGAGLGLSIAKWIAEAHHGALHVQSEAGKGSTFTLVVPLLDPKPVDAHARPTRRSSRLPLGG